MSMSPAAPMAHSRYSVLIPVHRVYDAGVAGLHRLLGSLPVLEKARCVVAVAGMAICSAVFPWPKITSAAPCRAARWWSTLAYPGGA